MTTLPRSIAAGMPAFWSSPTTGPGLKGVSPARTQRSSGATSPPRAGARVFLASSSLNKRNGLMSAVTTAVCPSIVSPNFTRSGFFAFACGSASRSSLFFATVIVARPQSFLRIAWNCGAGIPWMFTIPTTCAWAHREARSSTSRFLTGATWAIEITLEVLHRGTHRRLHVGRLDVEAPPSDFPPTPPHQGVQVLREILGRHVPRANRGMERPLVPTPDADRVPHRGDQVRRVCRGRHRSRHLSPRSQDDTESLPDHGHQRRLGDEEVARLREGASLPFVGRVFLDLLRLDDQVRDVSGLQGELTRSEHADANRFATSLRQDHFLVHPVLRDGQVDVSQVHGELDGLLELPRLCVLQELPDGLDRMLVRHGTSPPAVRSANPASCKGKATKGRGLNKVSGNASRGGISGPRFRKSTSPQPSRFVDAESRSGTIHPCGSRRTSDLGIAIFAVRQGSTSWLILRSHAMLASM